MSFILVLGFIAAVATYLGVDRFRIWAERRQLIDLPNERSSHTRPTPRGGGLIIAIVTLSGITLLISLRFPELLSQGFLIYLVGALLIAGISWIDDLKSLSSAVRLAVHFFAAVIAVFGIGYWQTISLPYAGTYALGWWGAALAVLWIVGLTNAYNFMDGTDGIAAGQALVAGMGWAFLGWHAGLPLVGCLGYLVACSSVGFLVHNWPPARIFMGDVGSAFLGYTLAVLPLFFSRFTSDPRAAVIGILVVWPFVFDAGFTFLMRLLRAENVFAAHRSHLYQRMSTAKSGHARVAVLYSGLALAGSLIAFDWFRRAENSAADSLMILPLLGMGLWAAAHYQERRLAGKNDSDLDLTSKAASGDALLRLWILRYRKAIIILSQMVLLAFAYYLSFMLRFDFQLVSPYREVLSQTLPIILAVKLGVFFYFRLFRGWWRYVGMSDLLDIVKAALVSTVILYEAIYAIRGIAGYPRSVFIIDALLTIIIIGGMRFAVRAYTESARAQITRTNALIIGAGEAGRAIARELGASDKLGYNLIGFVDDDPNKQRERIHGIRVLGRTDGLPEIIARHEVSQVLIAIPSATGREMQKIINRCTESRVDFKTLPAMADIISGSISIGLMRSVKVEDLLMRQPVKLDLAQIQRKFQQRAVLITGAAGSIGSEISRQIASYNPQKLILYERSESDLHRLNLELAEKFPKLARLSIIGDILDENRLRDALTSHRPTSVFHTAAYKHVPLMESNCFQAITNNVFGTYNVARMAHECGVEDFVLISSDKAVNPTSIMGVTKRVAEMLILGLQQQATRYVAVRFGNVLGSNGSVVPLFEQQIANRKPITVTHPEMQRFFMTIPEAVQLVLQASTMGNGGEVFVLDMGEPVKIVDLARNLIRLSGLEPGKDIPIVFTGLRPGEKLFEELMFDAEGLKPTSHNKIRVLDAGTADAVQVRSWLDELKAIVAVQNVHALVTKLREIVPEYTPSAEILALAKVERHDRFVTVQQARASLPQH